MRIAEEFRRWSLDPGRTNDELFTVELLLDWGRTVWGWKHKEPKPFDWDAIEALREERRLNPAYRPRLDLTLLDMAVEVHDGIKQFNPGGGDRPVRDLAALRFFPQLEEINVHGHGVDLRPLAGLRGLVKAWINDDRTVDLSPLGGLPALANVRLTLGAAWPDVRSLGDLPALRDLHFQGNLLALEGVPALPTATAVHLENHYVWTTPLRDLQRLPEMPAVRLLTVKGVDRLTGAARFPQVCNLSLSGPFDDLTPLAGAPQVTWLTLASEAFRDVAPLATLPRLRGVEFERERPFDLGPLVEAPALRQVDIERCPIVATELAALRAGFQPWADDFAVSPSRPLARTRFLSYDPANKDWQLRKRHPEGTARDEFFGDDQAWRLAEACWFARELQRALDLLLGRGWGEVGKPFSSHGGQEHVEISRHRDATLFPEIVQTLRGLLATTRFPWSYLIAVRPSDDLDDARDETAGREDDDEEGEEFDAENEREEWEDYRSRRREERAFLEREHRLMLQQQQGLPIEPEAFSPRTETPPTKPEAENATADGETVDAAESRRFGKELGFVVTLTEHHLWVPEHMKEAAAYLYGEQPEDWHALPEPVEERPGMEE